MIQFFVKNDLFTPEQFGFWSNHSCVHAISEIFDFIRDATEKHLRVKPVLLISEKLLIPWTILNYLTNCTITASEDLYLNSRVTTYQIDGKMYLIMKESLKNFPSSVVYIRVPFSSLDQWPACCLFNETWNRNICRRYFIVPIRKTKFVDDSKWNFHLSCRLQKQSWVKKSAPSQNSACYCVENTCYWDQRTWSVAEGACR